jgi:hydrogenase maturation protease
VATDFLIVGYGNTLRSDDGIGPRIADAVAAWRMPNVRAIALHQLTPELAEALAHADVAIFVDARVGNVEPQINPGVTFTAIVVADDATPASPLKRIFDDHIGDPRRLLALTRQVYGHCPKAWAISVPGVNFDLGETLSQQARVGVEVALRHIRLLFTSR